MVYRSAPYHTAAPEAITKAGQDYCPGVPAKSWPRPDTSGHTRPGPRAFVEDHIWRPTTGPRPDIEPEADLEMLAGRSDSWRAGKVRSNQARLPVGVEEANPYLPDGAASLLPGGSSPDGQAQNTGAVVAGVQAGRNWPRLCRLHGGSGGAEKRARCRSAGKRPAAKAASFCTSEPEVSSGRGAGKQPRRREWHRWRGGIDRSGTAPPCVANPPPQSGLFRKRSRPPN